MRKFVKKISWIKGSLCGKSISIFVYNIENVEKREYYFLKKFWNWKGRFIIECIGNNLLILEIWINEMNYKII